MKSIKNLTVLQKIFATALRKLREYHKTKYLIDYY